MRRRDLLRMFAAGSLALAARACIEARLQSPALMVEIRVITAR
jgi:hypothetical protein